MQPSPMLRREFERAAPARCAARLYVTALGVYEARDQRRGASATTCSRRAGRATTTGCATRRSTCSTMLREGANAIGAMLGDGWYRGQLGFPGAGGRNLYGDRLALLAQLEITYADGTTDVVATDGSWRAHTGPITSAGIYDGEHYDARLEQPGWSSPGFDDSAWSGVRIVERDLAHARSRRPGRRCGASRRSRRSRSRTSPSGKTIVDFGQNLVGWLRITVDGPAGHDDHAAPRRGARRTASSAREPLRGAKATDRYTLRGGGPETWEPRFTFHGFRYAEITGWPGELDAGRRAASSCCTPTWSAPAGSSARTRSSTACTRTSSGACEATSSTCRPTARSATSASAGPATSRCSRRRRAFLYDAAGFLQIVARRPRRRAARRRRRADGRSPTSSIAPASELRHGPRRSPLTVWGDAAVIVPWVLYQRYGDAGVLDAQYDSMRALGRLRRATPPARAACGTAASSSATGSTRWRRPTRRSSR